MPPPPSSKPLPRIITYFQTHHDADGKPISILPLVNQPGIAITHVIVAAIHINEDPSELTLNVHSPYDPHFRTLRTQLQVLQASGIKVMGMLGGAAKGSFERLDVQDENRFERYYCPLRDMIRRYNFDGIDLDVEDEMSLAGVVHLIDRIRADFGKDFIITLAPVAMALLDCTKNLSGFDYNVLEKIRGSDIAWYNGNFYCGWGDASNSFMYDLIIMKGWSPEKMVIGLVTNPLNCSGFVSWNELSSTLMTLTERYDQFGGVMGWEYFNSLPGGTERPWEWARDMTTLLRNNLHVQKAVESLKNEYDKTTDMIDSDTNKSTAVKMPKYHDRGHNHYCRLLTLVSLVILVPVVLLMVLLDLHRRTVSVTLVTRS